MAPEGYLSDKPKDDTDRYIKEVIYDVLECRQRTAKDEQSIREAIESTLELALLNHESKCEKKRRDASKFSLTTLLAAIAILVSILTLAVVVSSSKKDEVYSAPVKSKLELISPNN